MQHSKYLQIKWILLENWMRLDISFLLWWGLFGLYSFLRDEGVLAFTSSTPLSKFGRIITWAHCHFVKEYTAWVEGNWKGNHKNDHIYTIINENILLHILKWGEQVHGCPFETISFAISQPSVCIMYMASIYHLISLFQLKLVMFHAYNKVAVQVYSHWSQDIIATVYLLVTVDLAATPTYASMFFFF